LGKRACKCGQMNAWKSAFRFGQTNVDSLFAHGKCGRRFLSTENVTARITTENVATHFFETIPHIHMQNNLKVTGLNCLKIQQPILA